MNKEIDNIEWQIQKYCTDIGEYELIVEKQKSVASCDQRIESWKWSTAYHGSIVAKGSENSPELAKDKAILNTPSVDED